MSFYLVEEDCHGGISQNCACVSSLPSSQVRRVDEHVRVASSKAVPGI